jgi:hypothetical protein
MGLVTSPGSGRVHHIQRKTVMERMNFTEWYARELYKYVETIFDLNICITSIRI